MTNPEFAYFVEAKVMNRSHVLTKLHFVFALLICLLFVPETFGQTATSQPSSEGWQVQIIPYLWGTSVDGRVGVRDRTANVDASFRNILDHLHFAFMNLADATWNNKLVLLTDLVYSDLRGHHATPEDLLTSSVRPNQKLFLLTPEGGYRMLDTSRANVDYDKDHFLFDTALKGPLFGFTFKF